MASVRASTALLAMASACVTIAAGVRVSSLSGADGQYAHVEAQERELPVWQVRCMHVAPSVTPHVRSAPTVQLRSSQHDMLSRKAYRQHSRLLREAARCG
jgi:hypothetical protein